MKTKSEAFHLVVLIVIAMLLTIVLTSCGNETFLEGPFETTSVVMDTTFTPAHEEYGMHYGYSPMKGRMCMHMGYHQVSDKWETTFMFFNDTVSFGSEELYETAGDSVSIQYEKVYKIVKEDTLFIRNKILNVW